MSVAESGTFSFQDSPPRACPGEGASPDSIQPPSREAEHLRGESEQEDDIERIETVIVTQTSVTYPSTTSSASTLPAGASGSGGSNAVAVSAGTASGALGPSTSISKGVSDIRALVPPLRNGAGMAVQDSAKNASEAPSEMPRGGRGTPGSSGDTPRGLGGDSAREPAVQDAILESARGGCSDGSGVAASALRAAAPAYVAVPVGIAQASDAGIETFRVVGIPQAQPESSPRIGRIWATPQWRSSVPHRNAASHP